MLFHHTALISLSFKQIVSLTLTDLIYQIQLEDGETIDASLTEFEAEDERGEFAPQVVELDEHGREIGLYSL